MADDTVPDPTAAERPASGIGRRRAAARDDSSAAYTARRSDILAAAADLFKLNGYRATSISDIAEALGIDRASIYYYVGGKEELFDAIVSEVVRANATEVEAIRDGPGDVPHKLRTIVESLMRSYSESYPILYVYIQADLAHVADRRSAWSTEMRALNRRYVDVVVGLIETGIADGSIRPVAEPWVMAYGVIGTVGWTNRWFNPNRSDVDAMEIGSAYAEMMLTGMIARDS